MTQNILSVIRIDHVRCYPGSFPLSTCSSGFVITTPVIGCPPYFTIGVGSILNIIISRINQAFHPISANDCIHNPNSTRINMGSVILQTYNDLIIVLGDTPMRYIWLIANVLLISVQDVPLLVE